MQLFQERAEGQIVEASLQPGEGANQRWLRGEVSQGRDGYGSRWLRERWYRGEVAQGGGDTEEGQLSWVQIPKDPFLVCPSSTLS